MTGVEPERWQLRFDAYRRALKQLEAGITAYRERELSELERGGLVQAFEFTAELGWKLLADVLDAQGLNVSPRAPLPVVRAAFEAELIRDGDGWVDAVKLRNKLSHVYSEAVVLAAVPEIVNRFGAVLAETEHEIARQAQGGRAKRTD